MFGLVLPQQNERHRLEDVGEHGPEYRHVQQHATDQRRAFSAPSANHMTSMMPSPTSEPTIIATCGVL